MTEGGEPESQRAHFLRGRRWPALWIAACVIPLLVWMLLPGHPRLAGLYHDDGVYVTIGRSLLERGVYRDDHLPAPVETAKYPPGVPLLAALSLAVTGDLHSALACIRVLNVLFLALGLAAFWGILELEGLARAGPALVFAIGWSAYSADYGRVAMSEVPYLGVSLATVYLLLRCERAAPLPWRHAAWLAAPCIAAVALRSFGIVLALAVAVHLLLARRASTAFRFALSAAVPILGLQWFVAAHTTPAAGFEDVSVYGLSYSRLFLESLDWIGSTSWTNALRLLLYSLHHVVPMTKLMPLHLAWSLALLWLGVVLLFVLLFLGIRAERRPANEAKPARPTTPATPTIPATPATRPWQLLLLLSVALVLPWPADPARFLVPLVPFLLILIVRAAAARAGDRGTIVAALVLCGASLGDSMLTRLDQRPEAMNHARRVRDTVALEGLAERLHTDAGDRAVIASTADSLLGAHGRVRGVWGWSTTAERHIYQRPGAFWQFGFDPRRGDWVQRENYAASVLYLERTRPPAAARAHALMEQLYGARDPAARGAAREPLLAALESDAPAVREQYRRLGVTHAVLLLREGNPLYEVLLARLLRRLVAEGRAKIVTELSSDSAQVFEIDP